MDKNKHTDPMVLQSAELTERTPFCPDDQDIAEYYEGNLAEFEHQPIERHLTDCRFCLARIGMLNRQQEAGSTQRPPEEVLASAKRLAHKPPSRGLKRAPAWAAAAIVVISVFMVMNSRQVPLPALGTGQAKEIPAEENSSQLRRIDRSVINLNVLNPAPGETVAPGSLIRWAKIPGNIHYNVFILSNAGDVLWTERLQGTEWVMKEAMQLVAGNEYFLRVEAVLPDGGTLSSKHMAFRVTDRQ
jgi:hypothetical protein